ncbi:tetratricopeptide repeat protein [Candidatus Poribacteria bacterium]|nr:tetratricopeptide repeat protein [Candidatus Poribacteria bacterium]
MREYNSSTQESLKWILVSIRLAVKYHKFALYFVECSLSSQQDEYIAHLAQRCSAFDIVLVRVDLSDQVIENLRETVLAELHKKYPQQIPDNIALIITGLEASILLDDNETYPAVLQIMNLGRESYPKAFPYPFILWLSDKMLRKVQLEAPDFWSWRSAEPDRFAVIPDFLKREIRKICQFEGLKSWNDAVAQVSLIERTLEAYSELYDSAYTGLDSERLELLSRLGDAYRLLEKYQKAKNAYEKALKIAEGSGNSEKQATLLNKLGIVLRELRDLDQALEFFKTYLTFAEEHADLMGQSAALNNIGLIHLDKEELSDAINALEDALELNEESGDVFGSLGLAYHKLGEIDKAIVYHRRALEISKERDDLGNQWKDWLNLGLAYSKKGELEEAFNAYSEAKHASDRLGDLIGLKKCLIHLARCAGQMKSSDEIPHYEAALEIARKIQDRADEYKILIALAEAYRKNNRDKAISYYQDALKIAHKELGNIDQEISCYVALMQLHGREEPDSVARYKNIVKRLLDREGKLQTGKINAWLVDKINEVNFP